MSKLTPLSKFLAMMLRHRAADFDLALDADGFTDVDEAPVTPPEFLYHGTTSEALASIRQQGLKPQARQYVHLSLDPDWAQSVGGRHSGSPVVLRVRALEAHEAGHVFHHPEPKHYLTLTVPPEFIDFHEPAADEG